MPFKSERQRRYFAWKAKHSKTWAKRFKQWNKETGGRKLPEKK